jgi:Na+-driven multidrug efflux pump
MRGKKLSLDMRRGPLFSKIIRYALPLMLAYLLQLAFHAADMVVIGRWAVRQVWLRSAQPFPLPV